MNSNGNNSPVALAKLEKNINKYRRLTSANPNFKKSLANAEKRYQRVARTLRQRNVERSVSPGTVRNLIEQLNTKSPSSSLSSSPVGFVPISPSGGRRRRRNRKTHRRSRKSRSRGHK